MDRLLEPDTAGLDRQAEDLADRLLKAVTRCELDLRGRHVLTEAASGPYASTAVLAALAGAEVTALVRPTRYGTVAQVRAWTDQVAGVAGVEGIRITETLTPAVVSRADVVTNSGHLRPLDAAFVEQLKPTAVVPLMMEAWEIGAGRTDVDLDALRRRGIAFAGTNERHPCVGVFDYLGVMCVKLLLDAGVPVQGCRVVLLCDNPFSPYLERTLRGCGAEVTTLSSADEVARAPVAEAVVLAMTPRPGPRLTKRHLEVLASRMPRALVAQFFGDVDRAAAGDLGIACWPSAAPPHGHMGVLPSDVGPEPIVRLQAGGLKVGEVLLTPPEQRTASAREYLDAV